jgi:hypothetical protein
MERREFVETKKNGVKSCWQKPGTFLHRKVMPIILPRHRLEQGPCLCFQISCKIQDRVKGGGEGEAGKGAGLRNRVSWQESRH